VVHLDATVVDVTAPTYVSNGHAFQQGRLVNAAHSRKLQHYSHIFGANGKQRAGYTFIPVAMAVTGVQGKGMKQFLNLVKKMRTDAGKGTPPYLLAYWRRRLSLAFHAAVSKGARVAMKLRSQQARLPGWRQLNHVETLYAGDKLML